MIKENWRIIVLTLLLAKASMGALRIAAADDDNA
jgi:hypothetical protein